MSYFSCKNVVVKKMYIIFTRFYTIFVSFVEKDEILHFFEYFVCLNTGERLKYEISQFFTYFYEFLEYI